MTMDVKGKVVFITGAARGLGKGYAEALLTRGAKVFLVDLLADAGQATLNEFKDKFGSDCVHFETLDITDHALFEKVFGQCVDLFGQVDVMVNNAGVLNESIWKTMIEVNLAALVQGTQLAQAHMRKDKGGKGGRIINISSIAGLLDSFTMPIYCSTKHAVRSFTIGMAGQPNLESQGIEYAVLCPDPADTELMKLDKSKMHGFDQVFPFLEGKKTSVESVVEAFLHLLTLDKMNGGMLLVTKEGRTFQKMERQDMGTGYAPAF